MSPAETSHVVFREVQGWVGHRIFQIVDFIGLDHEAHGVVGDVAEIGVHHGMLLFILSSVSRSDEAVVAIDLFGSQDLNVDRSGNGDRAVFERHAAELFPDVASRIRVIEGDSMALRADDIRAVMNHDRVRIFSVDGGHNVEHVVNDMSLAQELIAPRGVVMLDDFFGPMWPSVTEGFYRYMEVANRRLAPFLIFQNKLFLTTYSEHGSVLAGLRSYVDRNMGAEVHTNWGYGKVCGFSVLTFAA